MARILAPLPSLQLDPRNTSALLNAIQTRIFLESGGVLNDFSPASPLSALTEGQAYASSELLYYLNNLPEAFALQWLKNLGVQRIIGSTSFVVVSFSKSQTFNRPVFIPKGTKLNTNAGLKFILTEAVNISETETTTTGVCVSEKWGSIYNIGRGEINGVDTPILGLESVFNLEPAIGGEDPETVDEMKSRVFTILRRRSLVSVEDYINETLSLIPTLDIIENVQLEDDRSLYLCIGNNSCIDIESSIVSNLLEKLQSKSSISTNIVILQPIYTPVKVELSVVVDSNNYDVDQVVEQIKDKLVEVITPSSFGLGGELVADDLLFNSFSVDGVTAVPTYRAGTLTFFEETNVNFCNPFFESEIDENGDCVKTYSREFSSSSDFNAFFAQDIETFKLLDLVITAITSDDDVFKYTYEDLYTL